MPSELRIPSALLGRALAAKMIKHLRLLTIAKLAGHRIEIKLLCKSMKVHSKTCKNLIEGVVEQGWAQSDGKYLFPRSWRKLRLSKRGGLYLTGIPIDLKKFEALCFAKALKTLYRRKGSSHSHSRRVKQKDFPARYLYKSLGLSQRRFERLKAASQKYGFIKVKPQVTIVGKANEFHQIQKHLYGYRVFVKGKHTVVPEISTIKVMV